MHNNPPHNYIAWSLREHWHKTSVLLLASFVSSYMLGVHLVRNDWGKNGHWVCAHSWSIPQNWYMSLWHKGHRSLCIDICIILLCAYTSCQSFLNKHHTLPFSSWHRQPTATSDKIVLKSSATAATTQTSSESFRLKRGSGPAFFFFFFALLDSCQLHIHVITSIL